jgi:hypothetical protein
MKRQLNIKLKWFPYQKSVLIIIIIITIWIGVVAMMVNIIYITVIILFNNNNKNEELITEEINTGLSKSTIKKASSSKSSSLSITASKSSPIKKCLYCGCKTTPMWRRGPQGAGTLCNACGVKWKHGKILNDNPPNNNEGEKKRKTSITGNKKTKKQGVEETGIPCESTTSSDSSPLDSFSGSPNTSPSLVTSLMEQNSKRKSLVPYDTKTLSVYVGEDAIEAAAVLTLLKKTK